MVGLLKRYRDLILVGLLLLIPLVVFFSHAKHPSERTSFDQVILAVTAPMEKGIAWCVNGALRLWNGYVDLRHAQERAWRLKDELNVVRLDQLELARLRSENERLAKLLAFAEQPPTRRVVGGRVIGVRLDPKGLQLVTIDRGAKDGIARMMPVVVGQGVVGRIHTVADSTADVLLLSDRNSSVAVRVERTRARANVRGIGSPDLCRLEYALRSDDMGEGDVLVTSGTDGVFPRGLPVGKITGLKRTGQGLYQRADVTPSVDVTKLEEVLVLTSWENPPEEEARAAPEAVPAASPGAPAAPNAAPAGVRAAPAAPQAAARATHAAPRASPAPPRTTQAAPHPVAPRSTPVAPRATPAAPEAARR